MAAQPQAAAAPDAAAAAMADLKNRIYRVTKSPEYESLLATGMPSSEALNLALQQVDPEAASAREQAMQSVRQMPGSGSGQTLKGPQ